MGKKLFLCIAAFLAVTVGGASAAMNPALAQWLPKADTGFDAWSKGEVARVQHYDYFICGDTHQPAESKESFYYAGSGCPQLERGTAWSVGSGEPIDGHILDDPRNNLTLFSAGCCAWRSYVLAANLGTPPIRTAQAHLDGVRTNLGIRLFMTSAQVMNTYGPAKPHTNKLRPHLSVLSYTTMSGGPNNSKEPCGQFQSFFFNDKDRLVAIELLMGC